jgi:hypothetical protein
MAVRGVHPRQTGRGLSALTSASRRLRPHPTPLGAFPQLSAFSPPRSAMVQPPLWTQGSSWSIEDPSARYRDNLGHTIAVLQDSYPKLFADVPDLSIYTNDIQFVHSGIPEGCLHGLAAYRRLFETLRLTRRTTVAEADLAHTVHVVDEATVRVRWHARLWLRGPLPNLVGVRGGGAEPLVIDGVSLYELDSDARICVHRLEYVERTPRSEGKMAMALHGPAPAQLAF